MFSTCFLINTKLILVMGSIGIKDFYFVRYLLSNIAVFDKLRLLTYLLIIEKASLFKIKLPERWRETTSFGLTLGGLVHAENTVGAHPSPLPIPQDLPVSTVNSLQLFPSLKTCPKPMRAESPREWHSAAPLTALVGNPQTTTNWPRVQKSRLLSSQQDNPWNAVHIPVLKNSLAHPWLRIWET